VLALSAALTVAAALAVYRGSGNPQVFVQGEGGAWIFPLDAVERLSVSGPLGDTVVEIRDGQARVLSSPCANQTCVSAGALSHQGQWAACLPNRVMLRIQGESDAPDAAAY